MWRLWPQEQVFIDGRDLNETVWYDYIHMAFNADYQGGKTTNQLLDQYGGERHVDERFRFQRPRVLVARRTDRPEPEGMEAGLSRR